MRKTAVTVSKSFWLDVKRVSADKFKGPVVKMFRDRFKNISAVREKLSARMR